ncbi:gamma-butyrobetaine hydroxylase-like domain-containing protein [Brucellaceae bacterium C25G]
MSDIWPVELRVSQDRHTLNISFDNGSSYALSAEMLRVLSPSAEVQGHSPEQRKTIGGKRNVKISRIEPIGNYAVRIVFDDRHDSGLFTWNYLHKLGAEHDRLWQAYLDELAEKSLSRDSRY